MSQDNKKAEKDKLEAPEALEPIQSEGDPRESRDKEFKRTRVPVHQQTSLSYSDRDDANFNYRYVNDTYGRVSMFLKAGWEIVEGDTADTFSGAGRQIETQNSSQIWRVVNEDPHAKCKLGALMRIPKKYYLEDQKYKEEQVRKKEALIDKTGAIQRARDMAAASHFNPLKFKKSDK